MSEETNLEKGDKKEKKKSQRKRSISLSVFDKDLLNMIFQGHHTYADLLLNTHVAEKEFKARLEELAANGILSIEGDVVKFGIKGYILYAGLRPKARPELKQKIEEAMPASTHHDKPRIQSKHAEPDATKSLPAWLNKSEVVDYGGRVGRMDLEEIIKKYGPSEEQKRNYLASVQQQTQQRPASLPVQPVSPVQSTRPGVQQVPKQQVSQPVSPSHGQVVSQETDFCELCKTQFKLVLNDASLSKYGHCFCGAAYHKECYDSLLAEPGSCIRCGKKLLLIVDKKSKEAIHGLRDAFE